MTHSAETLLEPVRLLCREAGRAIMEVYASPFAIEHKEDNSPLTEADLRSHHILEAGLKALLPEVPVLSEESASVAPALRRAWDWLWVVDPLDGTKEFIKRNDEFTVNVALVHQGRPLLGVVHAPALDLDYCAAAGLGAQRHRGGACEVIHAATGLVTPLRVVGSRSHRGSSLDGFLERAGEHELVAVGSSLKFCMVAEGAADVYPRLGPTSEWDTAAGQCVLEQAGGRVLELNGEPMLYNQRDTLLNPNFIACSAAANDWTAWLS
ncbi:MAG: 3'(2'),5'-bisphosphate nucleotidase CysQ [Steroidobacteraceae bacterium]